MTPRDALERQLIQHEALRFKPYDDRTGEEIVLPGGGKITVGVGHNLTDNGLSRDFCLMLFHDDLAKTIAELVARFPWFEELDATRQAVLVDMCFNLGITKLIKFSRTLEAMKAAHYRDASVCMLESAWADQVGKRAMTLATMMDTGVNPFLTGDD